MGQLRTRKNVYSLADWDDTLLWYAKAVAQMQTKPIGDPTSWRYQAAIHDYFPDEDPNADPSDQLPSTGEQDRFWKQCQHNSWFFLPWHRMYLSYFEQVVANTIVQLGGPDGWALPYWNYSDPNNADARRLPPAFRAAQLPDGSPNALRVDARNPGCNAGNIIAGDAEVDIQTCLTEPSYVAARRGGNPGFGGPQTVFAHFGDATGKLEAVPHGSMHVAVGGFMGAFHTAGLDPIFWLHHCNLDRLWAVWLKRDNRDVNPPDAQWLTAIQFPFHDAQGNEVSLTVSQVVDPSQDPLSYEYDDVSDPIGAAAPPPMEAAREVEMPERVPEMVGATESGVSLGTERTDTQLAIAAPTGPARESAALPTEIYLNLENITASGKPENYEVYLNVPPGEKPENHPELLAGLLTTFGAAESSRTDQGHSGGGLHHALEVGKVVRNLAAKGTWDPKNLRVTFVPKQRRQAETGTRETESAEAPIRIGRVSLYYS